MNSTSTSCAIHQKSPEMVRFPLVLAGGLISLSGTAITQDSAEDLAKQPTRHIDSVAGASDRADIDGSFMQRRR